MNEKFIQNLDKLPADVRRQFALLANQYGEKKKQSTIQNDFLSFVKHVWPDFVEGKHHKRIADKFNKLASGECKRLIINMPPRHTKSEFASYLLPSWMVGRKPDLKIIQTTHTTELAIRLWCLPSINSGHTCLTKSKNESWTLDCLVFSFSFIASFRNSFCASGGSFSIKSCFIKIFAEFFATLFSSS